MTERWGEQTDLGLGIVPDSFPEYELALRRARPYLTRGDQIYLPSEPAANAAWWFGDGYDTGDIRLHRALSSVHPTNIETLGREEGFVLELPGPYSEIALPRPNQWALSDPTDLWDIGDVPVWAQPIPVSPNFQNYDGTAGGW